MGARMIHTEEDDEFERIAMESNLKNGASGWRKRQGQPTGNEIIDKIRNDTLEEVAKEFDQMKAFGTTAESFACYVRDMKAKT
jgi:hypothetical protein